jgi:Uma2 family endonuclease
LYRVLYGSSREGPSLRTIHYPDVIVVCGDLQFDDDHQDTLLNPLLIIEVLSESTKDYDRGGKFAQYRKIPSFAEYVLVAQDECQVEHFVKQAQGRWLLSETNRLEDTLTLSSIECTLPLRDVYEKVQFPAV